MVKTLDRIEKKDFQKAWSIVREGLFIHHERDYERALKILDQLLEEIGEDNGHPLYDYLDALSTMIESYEKEHYPMGRSSGALVLQSLMEEHGLKQSDLPEVGSQGVISEIFHGKRQLTLRQIKALSERFQVSSSTFMD